MNVEELVKGLKEKGLDDNAIKAELTKIKADIDAYLNPAQKPAEEKPAEQKQEVQESDEDKERRIFGA